MKITKENIQKTRGEYNPKAILILVDELSEIMNSSNYKMVSSIQESLGSIARLGRAAGVHLCLATQRPSSNVINADLKNNIQMGVLLGDFDSGASTLIFDKDISDLSKPEIKGRGFIKSGKEIIEFQSYWTTKENDFSLKEESNSVNNINKTDEFDADGDEEKQKLIDQLTGKNEQNSNNPSKNAESIPIPSEVKQTDKLKHDEDNLRKEFEKERELLRRQMLQEQKEEEQKRKEIEEKEKYKGKIKLNPSIKNENNSEKKKIKIKLNKNDDVDFIE